MAAADRVARGDLSGQITVKSQDETGQLLSALQRMQHSLVSTVSAVRGNAQELLRAALRSPWAITTYPAARKSKQVLLNKLLRPWSS
jgi:methyl-accepting chemotaxis protein